MRDVEFFVCMFEKSVIVNIGRNKYMSGRVMVFVVLGDLCGW